MVDASTNQRYPRNLSRRYWAAVSCLLVVHSVLLAIQAHRNGPTIDELGHLASGLTHWRSADFEHYCVNPPLHRMLASIPLLLSRPKTDSVSSDNSPFRRPEFSAGRRFAELNGFDTFRHVTFSRWFVIPLSLVGALVSCRWATELHGQPSGILALSLWCFCPNLLAWGGQITPDASAASFGILAAWLFRKWLNQPTWKNAAFASLGLALAELTKTSWAILFGVWLCLWVLWRWRFRWTDLPQPAVTQLVFIIVSALYLLNAGYGFENTCQRLDSFTFVSHALGGDKAHQQGGNRFDGSFLGGVPVPVPANFLRGLDLQKYEFEIDKRSFLRGEKKNGGWWYYYVYGLIIKIPVGFTCLIAAGVGSLLCGSPQSRNRLETIFLLTPAVTLMLLVSSQTAANRHVRYVVPALPFLYVAASSVGRVFSQRKKYWQQRICVAVLVIGVGSSLSIFPYSMSYFNVCVGGPIGGKNHLLDSNIDWGQDLRELVLWIKARPESDPPSVAYFGCVDLEVLDLPFRNIPSADQLTGSPPRGLYAVSVNHLMGYTDLVGCPSRYAYFQELEPIDRIGYSIYVYRIGEADAEILNDFFEQRQQRPTRKKEVGTLLGKTLR